MRTGNEYREALRDGRDVWVVGEGRIDDVTAHPATRAMVDEYVAWYDRQNDPAWADRFRSTPTREREPWGAVIPRAPADLAGMGRYFYAMEFPTGGNITHTPTYGNLISLGIRYAVEQLNVSQEQISTATRYRDLIASTGRFLTFSAGTGTIGYRMRPDPRKRAGLRLVRETDAGLVRHRQDRHVDQPRICGGRVHRQLLRSVVRRPFCDLQRAGECAGRPRHLSAPRGAPFESIHRAHVEPLRRAGRADMA